jgi:uncharacterized membrane protein HdeD (DUF308 family)
MSSVLSGTSVSGNSDDGQPPQRAGLAFTLLGILMVAMGMFAIGWSCLTTLSVMAVWVFGFMLLGGGIAEILSVFAAGRTRSRLMHLLVGVLYVLVGFMFISEPKDSAVRLTLIFAIFLMVAGAFRIVFAISEQFPGRGSVLISGLLTLTLGILVYRQWPVSGLWAIGLFMGVEMLTNGWALIMLSLGLRRMPPARAAAPAVVQ